jgi:ATP-dependent Clp protease protease subunit
MKVVNLLNNAENMAVFSGSLIPQMKLSLALNQRKIYLYDDVCENSIFECIYYLDKLRDIDSVSGEKKPIEILINSNGGYIYEGLALISTIEMMKDSGYEIITTNVSKAFSMGFIISLVGSKRYSYRHSFFMVHDASTGMWGKIAELKEELAQTTKVRNAILDITTKYSNLTMEQLMDWIDHKQDVYFNAEEALELGIIDKII